MNKTNFPKQIIEIEETTSTNEYLRELYLKETLPEGTVIMTDFQTKGKGQAGNYWESEASKNLLFSILLYPNQIAPNRQFIISQLVALSMQETLKKYLDNITVKWPNDIYYQDQKIAGILVENDICGKKMVASIIGIGLNVNQEHFFSDAPNPVSMKQLLQVDTDRKSLFFSFMERLSVNYLYLLDGEEKRIQENYSDVLFRKDGYFLYEDKNGKFYARIAGIDALGRICLEKQNGERGYYYFKEVTYIL